MDNLTEVERRNIQFLDLYGNCLKPFITLLKDATFEDIKKVVDAKPKIGYEHCLLIGDRKVIAFRKYTWKGRVAITSYLHLYQVSKFTQPFKIINHWREQKDGTFKTQ